MTSPFNEDFRSVFGFNVGNWQWRNLRFEPSGAKLSWRGPTRQNAEKF